MAAWFRQEAGGARITIRVGPNARSNAITGSVEIAGGTEALGVKLAAKPVDNAANNALISMVAEKLGVAKSAIRLVAGQKNRLKSLHVAGDWHDLSPRLTTMAAPRQK